MDELAVNKFSFSLDDFVPQGTIDALLESAGVGEDYISYLENGLGQRLSDTAKSTYYNTMNRFKNIIAENIAQGEGIKTFIDRLKKDNLLQKIGIGENPWYAENVYRTNFVTAHSAGRWNAAQENKEVLYLEYFAIGDDRTTDICSQLNGTIKLKDDPFWDSFMPPNHFSCRSQVGEITRTYAAAFNVVEVNNEITAAPGKDFDVNPGKADDFFKTPKSIKDKIAEFE